MCFEKKKEMKVDFFSPLPTYTELLLTWVAPQQGRSFTKYKEILRQELQLIQRGGVGCYKWEMSHR